MIRVSYVNLKHQIVDYACYVIRAIIRFMVLFISPLYSQPWPRVTHLNVAIKIHSFSISGSV